MIIYTLFQATNASMLTSDFLIYFRK